MFDQQTKAKDYYKILGVAEDASAEEIRRAYRKLARKYHPDVSKESDAEERFKEVNEAHDVLRDTDKRSAYDRIRQGGFDPSMFGPGGGASAAGFDLGGDALKDLFESMFGGSFAGAGRQRGGFQTRGNDLQATLQVSLEIAYHGGPQRISVGDRSLQVKIPAGVENGQKIRLSGQGEPGLGGGPSGDLILEVTIARHHRFELDGRNLLVDLPLAPWEAALGTSIKVPTLSGDIDLKIPAAARSGQKLRLRGRGMPSARATAAGDLLIRLLIQTPPADDDRLRELYEELRERSGFDPRAG